MRLEMHSFIFDALRAADHVSTFVEGVSQERYRDDQMRKSAVERELSIIGEALKRARDLDPELQNAIPDLHRIIGMRNVLVHGYAQVSDTLVWTTATSRIPALVRSLRDLVESDDHRES